MKILLTLSAFTLFFAGVVLTKIQGEPKLLDNSTGADAVTEDELAVESQDVKGEVVELEEEKKEEEVGSEEPQQNFTPTPSPTTIPQNTNSISINEYIYPGATIISISDKRLSLTSKDDPKTITDWYKNIFEQKKLKSRSFAQTNVNGNIENKLAAAGNGIKVSISITQKPQEDTKIEVVIE